MELFLPLLGLIAAAVEAYFSAFVALFLLPVAAIAAAGAVFVEFATGSVRGYRGDAPLDALRITPAPPESGKDPGYRSYFFGPALRELQIVLTDTTRRGSDRLKQWVSWTIHGAFSRFPSIWWRVGAFLPCCGIVIGIVLGGVGGGVVLGCVALVFGIALAVVVLCALAIGATMRVIELAVLTIRGITLECPQCNERVRRPAYRCSGDEGCDAQHNSLVPGQLGIFFRVCRCGRPLPTLLVLGKHGLAAQCEHCQFELPRRGYSAPTLHIPVAGGAQVGKSVFMFSAVKRLHDEWETGAHDSDFWADERFAETFVRSQAGIANPDQMSKTTETRPRAYNIYVGRGVRQRRLIYLFDTAGEIYDEAGELARASFFTHAQGLVVCIDPFSLAGLRRSVDRETLDRVRASPTDPKATIERLTENLREAHQVSGSRKLKVKVAVVLTKADALADALVTHPYASLPPPNGTAPSRRDRDAAVQAWIANTGVRGDIVTSVLGNFETTSFFVVSHTDAALMTPKEAKPNDDPADPINWLLERGAVR